MGTITAQLLVGGSHPNDGGIIPEFSLYLHEGSQAAWVLEKVGVSGRRSQIVWSPSVDYMLDDGLLMVALLVEGSEWIKSKMEAEFGGELPQRLDLIAHFNEDVLGSLRETARTVKFKNKLVLTALMGSHILNQLDSLKHYHTEMEVCIPVYSRTRSMWDAVGQYQIRGTLEFER